MATTIAASLTLDTQQAETSVKSFRAQLREATQNLIQIQEKFGETSAEASAAAKSVANLRDRMDDAKQLSDAFNPDAKFNAFTKALQGTVGGVTALTGAMALFGNESEDVQKALLKVQGALALSQGLSQIGELGKSFAILKVTAVEAFTAIKAAIGSTGIGLIVIAVGTLVAYWDDIKVAIGGATTQQIKYLEQTTKSLDIEKQKLDIITSQQNILKQQGFTQSQILELQNKQLDTAIIAAEKQLKAQQVISDQAIKAAKIGANGALAAGGLSFLANLIYGKPEDVKNQADKVLLEAQNGLTKLKDQLAANQLAILKTTSDFEQKIIDLQHAAGEAGLTDQYVLSQRRLKDSYDQAQQQTKLEYTNLDERHKVLSALEAKYFAESAALAKANNRKLNDDLRKLNFDASEAKITDQYAIAQNQLQFQLALDIKQTTLEISNAKDRNEKIAAINAAYLAKSTALAKDHASKLSEDLRKLYFDAEQTRIYEAQKLEDAQLKYQYDTDIDQAKKDIANAEDRAQKIAAITELYEAKTLQLQTARAEQLAIILEEPDKKAREAKQQGLILDKEISDAHLDIAGQQAAQELDNLEKWYSDKLSLISANEEEIVKLNKEYERQKTEITDRENQARLSIISGVLGQAASLFSQASAAGKVLAIAQATIDTYQSAVASYKSLAGIPIVGPALGFAAAGVAIAAGLANVKKIVSVQVPGAASVGGGVGSISASAPLQVTPQVGNTQLPQQQINQIGNASAPVRAFVVESDVSGSQERVTRLNRAARLGG